MTDLGQFYDYAALAEASYVDFDKLDDFLATTVKVALQPPAKINGNFSATVDSSCKCTT